MKGPIVIAKDEERHNGLIERLKLYDVLGVPGGIPVDYAWAAHGVPIMGDNKTPQDLIASALDGRLHNQIQAMKEAKALGFILVEGEWSQDGGHTVGDVTHGWTWDQFDNLLFSLQTEGILVAHVVAEALTPKRLASLYTWTTKDRRGSWHTPVPLLPPAQDFFDKEYRKRVGMMMSLPSMGADRASKLVHGYGLMGALGITEEGLATAKKRWLEQKGIGSKLADTWEAWLRG